MSCQLVQEKASSWVGAQWGDFQCCKSLTGLSSWICFCGCQTQRDVEWNPAGSRSVENGYRIAFSVEQPKKREGNNSEDSQNKYYFLLLLLCVWRKTQLPTLESHKTCCSIWNGACKVSKLERKANGVLFTHFLLSWNTVVKALLQEVGGGSVSHSAWHDLNLHLSAHLIISSANTYIWINLLCFSPPCFLFGLCLLVCVFLSVFLTLVPIFIFNRKTLAALRARSPQGWSCARISYGWSSRWGTRHLWARSFLFLALLSKHTPEISAMGTNVVLRARWRF